MVYSDRKVPVIDEDHAFDLTRPYHEHPGVSVLTLMEAVNLQREALAASRYHC